MTHEGDVVFAASEVELVQEAIEFGVSLIKVSLSK